MDNEGIKPLFVVVISFKLLKMRVDFNFRLNGVPFELIWQVFLFAFTMNLSGYRFDGSASTQIPQKVHS